MTGNINIFEKKLFEVLLAESITAMDVVQVLNALRKSKGLYPVEPCDDLRIAAKIHAKQMASADDMQHVLRGAKYPTPADRMRAAGYGSGYESAEVIASGQTTPTDVVKGWLNSPRHKEAILHPDVEDVGASVQYSDSGVSYTCAVLCMSDDYDDDDDDDDRGRRRSYHSGAGDEWWEIGSDILQLAKKHGKSAGKKLLTKIAQTDKAKEMAKSPIIQKIMALLK
jgi:hypothetical protein